MAEYATAVMLHSIGRGGCGIRLVVADATIALGGVMVLVGEQLDSSCRFFLPAFAVGAGGLTICAIAIMGCLILVKESNVVKS